MGQEAGGRDSTSATTCSIKLLWRRARAANRSGSAAALAGPFCLEQILALDQAQQGLGALIELFS
jgi:hypothetical protein